MIRFSRRRFIAGGAAGAALLSNVRGAQAAPAGAERQPLILNDASHLSRVQVARHAVLPSGEEHSRIETLRALLRTAAREGLSVCTAGARHSMGGQSLVRDGIAVSLGAPMCQPDVDRRT